MNARPRGRKITLLYSLGFHIDPVDGAEPAQAGAGRQFMADNESPRDRRKTQLEPMAILIR